MASREILLLKDALRPIRIEYSDNDTYFGDTAVTIYDDYKISLVLTDNCGAVIGDKVFFPKRGDIMIFRPEEIHFGRFPKSDRYRFISFLIPLNFFENFCFDAGSILYPFSDKSESKLNLIRLSDENRARMIALAEELLALAENNEENNCFDIMAFAKLTEVLAICSKAYKLQKNAPYGDGVQPIITKAMQMIDNDFPDFAGLNNLAEYCGCSITHLTQTFRRYTGKSIHVYITQRRLENARRLLQKGASVTEACYQSGFSDCSGFIVVFKKHYNITPGKYRKSL